jgi:hypothetical protein
MSATATVQTSELLEVEGFIGKILCIPSQERIFVTNEDGETAIESGRPTTIQIEEMIHGFPITPFGSFDVMGLDADGAVHVLEGKFIHEIEDMLVGPCSPECADCARLREEG